MKTRMRRFWISVSLTAGSLALPLSGVLRAHDLPTRWTSGANSTPSWNYLLEDCFDSPMLHGSQSLTDVESTMRRGTEDWASSCPSEWAADANRIARPADIDYDALLRNPISRFSKEMTCWVNEWQMIQVNAKSIEQPRRMWARLPDVGNPPAPDYGIQYVSKNASVPLVDTCAFDAEYQARETAADLLSREIARANEIAKNEARLSQALADVERIAATIGSDAIAENAPVPTNDDKDLVAYENAAPLLIQAEDLLERPLCGGESSEIMSDQCFADQRPAWETKLREYAPGIIDEYVAYDLDPRDQHWLGGLGKSWKLRSAICALPVPADLVAADLAASDLSDEGDVWAVPVEAAVDAPEAFVAPDQIPSDLANSSAMNDAEIRAYLDGVVEQAQQSAMNLLTSAREATTPILSDEHILPELLPNLGLCLAAASDWVEEQQCRVAGELCGFDSAYQVGGWLGDQSQAATGFVFSKSIELGHYLDASIETTPADIATSDTDGAEHTKDVYVIYVDAEGNSLAVPSSLARAWNRPEAEAANASEPATEPADESFSGSSDWVLVDQVGTQIISMLANQLSSFGLQLMQASDLLSSWADTQIASRESSVR